MHRLFYLFLFLVVGSFQLQSQTFEIVSPAGLTPPYEVAPGTEVTFKWDYFFETPTSVFTHTEAPIFPGFGTDPNWSDITGAATIVDNGDGTFNITTPINEKIWVWGGFFAPFISQWNYSNILEINVASDVVISGDDLLLCNDGIDTETLSVMDTFSNYQWYMDGSEISGATSASYDVSQPGSYYVAATYNSEVINSNTLNLSYIEISFSGALGGSSDIVLTGTSGMDTYQWLSGPDAGNLSPIAGANSETYNAPITATLTFYSLEATLGSCTIQSNIRSIVESFFTPPVIQIQADTNSFNVICEGTSVTFSVDDNYDSYKWLRDGFDAYNSFNSINLSQVWQEGNYAVEVTNTEWPEIVLTSAAANLNYQNVIQPQLVGVNNYQKYCPGDNLDAILGDEGYVYTWYLHGSFNYTNDDIINVTGSTYSFTFDTAVYISVVGEFQGCTASKTVFLDSYNNSNIFLNTADYNQDYLCTDSTNTIFIPSFAAGDYQDFQWYRDVAGTYEPIAGADTSFLEINEPGSYKVEATVIACPSVVILSNEKIIYDYTERNLSIYAYDQTLCVGDTTTLSINGGSWESIQWHEEDIIIGSNGYEKSYIPMVGAGNTSQQDVSEFQTYLVKAKHFSCPNGLKNTSNIIGIRPTVNPTITPDPNYGIYNWHISPYDSIANYIFCTDEPTTLSVSGQYDSYTWFKLQYAGDDDYALGNEIAGANTDELDIIVSDVDWYTAVVDSAGCIGYSDPILMDTWAFLPPVVASYNNNEICLGDSALLNIAFTGDWGEIYWTQDGNIIPNSNNDSIYVTEPGTYVVYTYPTLCPQFPYTSGIGPTLTLLEAEISEIDTLIYALPFTGGNYTYQWYFNGNPIPSGPTPWTLHQDSLMNGIYTVEISNDDCTVLSEDFIWDQVSINGINLEEIKVYPNPTDDVVFIEGLETTLVEKIIIYNLLGMQIGELETRDEKVKIDLSNEEQGIYILEVKMKNGESLSWKINRM